MSNRILLSNNITSNMIVLPLLQQNVFQHDVKKIWRNKFLKINGYQLSRLERTGILYFRICTVTTWERENSIFDRL